MKFLPRKILIFAVCLALVGAASGVCRSQPPPAVKKSEPEKSLQEAVRLLGDNDREAAKNIVLKVLKIFPRNVAANTLAGIIADRENDLKNAEKHFGLAAKLAPSLPETRNNYGAVLLRLDRRAEAAREFASSLKANPRQPSALINLAQIRFEGNDFSAARDLFEKAQQIEPDAKVARALVIADLRLKDAERAKADFRKYFELAGSGAIAPAERAELGAALLESGLIAEAVRELEAARKLDPSNADTLVSLSRAYLQQNDVKSAGRLLESAVAGGMDESRLYFTLAEVYEAGGFFENAIPAMRLAVEKDPANEFYRFRYGMLLTDSKAPAAAVIRLEEALKEFPDSAKLWLALGIAHFNENKTAEAQKAFEKALAIEPKLIPALAYLGTAFIERARYEEAAKIYERALAIDGRNAILHFLLADTLLKMPDSDPARIENHLKQSVLVDENLAAAHLALGRLRARRENWTEAAASLEKAMRLEPENTETLYQLGRVYARLKRADESKTVLAKFKQLSDAQKEQKEIDRRELVRRMANVRF